MIDITGCKDKKVLSYSSASTTIVSPFPEIAFVLNSLTIPPITIVGSFLALYRILPIIEHVVVFP